MSKNKIISSACLLLAAVIWGLAFVAQDVAAEQIAPFTVNATRSFIASFVLLPVAWVFRKMNHKPLRETAKKDRNLLLKAGVICGVFLCIAVNFQQFGIAMYPSDAAASGRAGFLTALYIIFVPLFSLFFKKKPGLFVMIALALAVAGLYFLCLSNGLGALYAGDLVVLLCAVSFAAQIIAIDRYIDRVDAIKLSCIQFFVTGVLSSVLMFLFEKPSFSSLLTAFLPILYLGVMSSGVAYTLQIVGQKYAASPTASGILMSMESVFAVIGGAFRGESMSQRELLGCGIMFVAIILAQLPDDLLKRKKQRKTLDT